MTKLLLFIKFITCRFIWLPKDGSHLGHSAWAPLLGNRTHYFQPTSQFIIGRRRTWVRPGGFLSTTRRVTVRTTFFSSVSILTIPAIGHWFRWHSFFNSTTSPTVKFGVCFFNFCLGCRLWRNSFLHLLQNSSAIYWTRHHRFLEYRSGGLNSPGGGMFTLDFKVRRLLGDIGVGLFASFRVSTVRGLEFTINSTSVIKVLRDSSFNDKLWVLKGPSNSMFLAVRIWRFQTKPICDAAGGLWCQSVQSALFSCKKFLILSWFISLNRCCNSFLVPTKFVPLSDQMDLTAPLLAINLLSARMKELVPKAFVTSICMARQVKHGNNAPYLFNCDLFSLMR